MYSSTWNCYYVSHSNGCSESNRGSDEKGYIYFRNTVYECLYTLVQYVALSAPPPHPRNTTKSHCVALHSLVPVWPVTSVTIAGSLPTDVAGELLAFPGHNQDVPSTRVIQFPPTQPMLPWGSQGLLMTRRTEMHYSCTGLWTE